MSTIRTERLTLPWDVRYALEYKGAEMGKHELQSLLDERMVSECLYLLARSLNHDPAGQLDLFQGFVNVYRSDVGAFYPIEGYLRERVEALPEDFHVFGSRLAQICRQGFEFWQTRYSDAMLRCARAGRLPAFVLCGTCIGFLDALGMAARMFGGMFLALNPVWIRDVQKPYCGYGFRVLKDNNSVMLLKKGDLEPLPGAVRIIDDVQDTGATKEQVCGFWPGHHDFEALCISCKPF